MQVITVEFWGPMAMFCPPYAKVDRFSYPVPTPSAIRGALASVYSKPAEFYWAVRKIEVMNPIKRISVKRNEVTKRYMRGEPICADDCRTQRAFGALKNVRYRVTAEMVPARGNLRKPMAAIADQAVRRFEKGQCFQQPYLGTRECVCDFAMADMGRTPIDLDMDLNLMVFDTHVPYDNRKDAPFSMSLYHAVMVGGAIIVPDYDDDQVIKLPDSIGMGMVQIPLQEGGGVGD